MSYLLSNCWHYKVNISDWDVSNVKNMSCMFSDTTNFFSGEGWNNDISNWDVSNVEDMSGMFEFSRFNRDISKWNVSKVKDMSFMFKNSSFNKDISNWDVSNVENMSRMFGCSVFNQDIGNWDVSNVKDMNHMFFKVYLIMIFQNGKSLIQLIHIVCLKIASILINHFYQNVKSKSQRKMNHH